MRAPDVIETFAFLVRDYGFTGPVVKAVNFEVHHVYSHGDVRVDIWTESQGPWYVVIFVDGWMYELDHLSVVDELEEYQRRHSNHATAIARFLADHPELLCGDADYLDALEDEWYVKRKLRPWRRGLRLKGPYDRA